MAELLVELFSEEIPARMQARAAADLERLVCESLKEAGLEFADAAAYATPRRLALMVDGLPRRQPDRCEERRGPRADAPEKAIAGFVKSVGLKRDQLEARETPKGTFLFALIERPGRATSEVLAEILPEAIAAVPWPKSMRWGGEAFRWVRPLHGIVALFERQVVPFELGGVRAGDVTFGHRVHAPGAIEVTGFEDYRDKLLKARVVLDPAERARRIRVGTETLAGSDGLELVEDEDLLAEVTGLVEWPVPLMGAIDASFMDLPAEVLATTLKHHQKYFSLKDNAGALAPRFIVVANTEADDGGTAMIAGNERVLKARLADARFFWDQDRKRALESRVPELKDVIFHDRLGSLGEKVERLAGLAGRLCQYVPGADAAKAERTARLCKADLVTGMVGEFPELQGVMGRYYALADGEDPAVAEAIADHYAPQGPSDRCPTAPESVAVALADKIDTLVGFFAIKQEPTGSKDPFALRRAALGVIRLIVENGLRVPLFEALSTSRNLYSQFTAQALKRVPGRTQPVDVTAIELVDFFADRLKVHLREKGVRHDLIGAVFALGGEDDLVRLLKRVDALARFLDSEDGANLLVAYRRAANIVRIEEKKDATTYDGAPDESLLKQDEERALAALLPEVAAASAKALRQEDFEGAMAALARLRAPVDAFFDRVTVNTEKASLRRNRLRLLSRIRATLGAVADFSRIEG